MNEGDLEKSSEIFPTEEELKSIFENILKEKEHTILGAQLNEKGLFLYEVETIEDGAKVLYIYTKANYDYRKESLPASAKFSASIHKVLYNDNDVAISCDTIANYLDGKWFYL